MKRETGPDATPILERLFRSSPLRPVRLVHVALAIVALGLIWRVFRYALGFPIWGDEAFVAVNLIERDYAGMIRPLLYGQIVPLVFMWAELAVSRGLDSLSEWALRLVPFLAGVAAPVLFWRFAARVLPRRPALLAVAIFAASYYCVRHAAEVKPYATDLLISLTLTMLGWGACQRPRSIPRWTALIIAALLAPWCSYPSIFVGGAVVLLFALRICTSRSNVELSNQSFPIAGPLTFTMTLAASFLAMYWFYGKPHAEYASRLTEIDMWARTFPPLGEPWKIRAWFLLIHTGNLFAYPTGGANGASVATFFLFLVGAAHLDERNRPLLVLLVGPFVLTLAAACLHLYPYGGSARTSLYVAPAICLLAGLGAWRTLRWIIRRFESLSRGPAENVSVKLAVVACGVGAVYGMYRDWREPSKDPAVTRSHNAVRGVAAQVGPNDRWIIFNSIEPVAWAPSLNDRPWWGTGGQFVFDCLRFSPVKVEWSSDPATVNSTSRVWLLAYRGVRPEFPQTQLDEYVSTLAGRFGEPQHNWYLIKEKHDPRRGTRIEGIDVYRFGR